MQGLLIDIVQIDTAAGALIPGVEKSHCSPNNPAMRLLQVLRASPCSQGVIGWAHRHPSACNRRASRTASCWTSPSPPRELPSRHTRLGCGWARIHSCPPTGNSGPSPRDIGTSGVASCSYLAVLGAKWLEPLADSRLTRPRTESHSTDSKKLSSRDSGSLHRMARSP